MNIYELINNPDRYYLLKQYKIYYLKDIFKNENFIKKINNNKKTYPEIVLLIDAMKSDNINDIIKYSDKLSKYVKYTIFCAAYYKTEEEINYEIKNKLGVFLPKVINYYINDMLRDNYIYKFNYNNIKTIYISNLNGLINLYINPFNYNYKDKSKKRYSGLDIFKLRLEGKLYKEISEITGCSKQLISLKISKIIKIIPEIYENRYFNIFSKYKIYLNDFRKIFGIDDDKVYYYLKMIIIYNKTMHNRKNLNNILDDNNKLSQQIENNIKRTFSKEKFIIYNNTKLYINNKIILKYIFNYLLNNNNYAKITTFQELYFDIINKIPKEYNFKSYSLRSLRNKLYESNQLILSINEQIRCYDINSFDINLFISKYNLYQYKNIYISSQILIDKNPEILKELKINNCYELHNLIKKKYKDITLENKNKLQLTLLRRPHLKFGNANLKKQISDLIQNNPDMKHNEISKKINHEYGFKFNTILSNYIPK